MFTRGCNGKNGLKMIFLKTTLGDAIVFVMKRHIDMKIFKLKLIEVFILRLYT
jgi:hypothetical protein